MALPTSLAYMSKPSAVASRSVRASIAPVNGSTFNGPQSQTIRLEIPTGVQGQYLNPAQSYLKFSLRGSGDFTSAKLDQSVYSIFSRLVISHNGVVLEDINEYGVLANLLLDFSCSASQLDNDLNVMIGTTALTNATTGQVGGAALPTKNTTTNLTDKMWFNMPLLSSFFTMLGDKYLPIGDIKNELRVELTLAPQGLIWTGGTAAGSSYEVSDVELLTEIVELDPAVAAEIRKETLSREGAFKIPVVQWRNYNSSIPSLSAMASVIVPAKFNSLKTILVTQRLQTNVTTYNLSKNERIGGSASFGNYWFQIGSHFVPSKPVANVWEAYAELQKSMHDLSLANGDSILSRNTYTDRKFMIGVELESLSHRSDVLNSGLNTTSLNIYWNPQFSSVVSDTRRVDFFAHYDGLVMIDPIGQMNIVF